MAVQRCGDRNRESCINYIMNGTVEEMMSMLFIIGGVLLIIICIIFLKCIHNSEYRIKVKCKNCGKYSKIEIPKGSSFIEYEERINNKKVWACSGYKHHNIEFKRLYCKYCGVARLEKSYW